MAFGASILRAGKRILERFSPKARKQGTTPRPSNAAYAERKLPSERSQRSMALARMLAGIDDDGKEHVNCTCKCGSNKTMPCYYNLWDDTNSASTASTRLENHLELFLSLKQQERGDIIFPMLQQLYMRNEKGDWVQRYKVNGRFVCRSIFLLFYPVSNSTLYRITVAIKNGQPAYYRDESSPRTGSAIQERKRLHAIGWICAWADALGDRLPGVYDVGKLYVPRIALVDLHDEFHEDCISYGMEESEVLKYDTFVKVWNEVRLTCPAA